MVTAPPAVILTTTASAGVTLGGAIHDTATLSGGTAPTAPTGTLTFRLFGPGDATCTGTPIFTATVAVLGAGSYPSDSFTATSSGTYRWTAAYSGDANNAAVATACGDPAESVVVTAPPVASPPSIRVDGTADAASVPAPGGTFAGRVSVTNTSPEALTIIALADEDLNGVGTCTVPQPVAPDHTYSRTSRSCSQARPATPGPVPVTATAVDAQRRSVIAANTFVLTIKATAASSPQTGATAPTAAPEHEQGPVNATPLARTGANVAGTALLAFGLLLAGTFMLVVVWLRAIRPSAAGPRRRRAGECRPGRCQSARRRPWPTPPSTRCHAPPSFQRSAAAVGPRPMQSDRGAAAGARISISDLPRRAGARTRRITSVTDDDGEDRIVTIPNVLSVVRLLSVSVFLYLLFPGGNRAAAAILLAGLGTTDWVDGYVARRFHQVSSLGKVLDPVADRCLLIVGVTAIVVDGSAPLWLGVAALLREGLITFGTVLLVVKGARRLDVQWVGKAGTFGLMFAFPMFLASHAGLGSVLVWRTLAWVCAIPGLVFGFWSVLVYIPMAKRALDDRGVGHRQVASRPGSTGSTGSTA